MKNPFLNPEPIAGFHMGYQRVMFYLAKRQKMAWRSLRRTSYLYILVESQYTRSFDMAEPSLTLSVGFISWILVAVLVKKTKFCI